MSSSISSLRNYNIQKGGNHNRFKNCYEVLDAFETQNWKVIETIIQNNLLESVTCQDANGNTVLHKLIIASSEYCDKLLCFLNLFKIVLSRDDAKRAIDIPNHDRKTPFYLSVELAEQTNNKNIFIFSHILDKMGAIKKFGNAEIVTEQSDVSSVQNTVININVTQPQQETRSKTREVEQVLGDIFKNIEPDQEETEFDLPTFLQTDQKQNNQESLLRSIFEKINNDNNDNMDDIDDTDDGEDYSEMINKLLNDNLKNDNEYNNNEDDEHNTKYFDNLLKKYKKDNIFMKQSGGKKGHRKLKLTSDAHHNRTLNSTDYKQYAGESSSDVMSNELGQMVQKHSRSEKDKLHQEFLETIKKLLEKGKLLRKKKAIDNTADNAMTIKSYLYRKLREKHPENTGAEIIKMLIAMSDKEIIRAVDKIPNLDELRETILKNIAENKKKKDLNKHNNKSHKKSHKKDEHSSYSSLNTESETSNDENTTIHISDD